ncbi:MAG: hypothetical protein JKY48_10060 [Flavobacteriales bacterium]|nr:hypothetical protein [Flavobacteriales bacterium]
MNKLLGILLILIVFISCKNVKKEETKIPVKTESQEITTDNYELSKPTQNIKKVLVLFGGFQKSLKILSGNLKYLNLQIKIVLQ